MQVAFKKMVACFQNQAYLKVELFFWILIFYFEIYIFPSQRFVNFVIND